jgi:hypothetical protein
LVQILDKDSVYFIFHASDKESKTIKADSGDRYKPICISEELFQN